MSSNKIILKSSDGESFEVEEAVARKLRIVKHMIEDDCLGDNNTIPLENVTGKILSLVIKYCKNHVNENVTADSTERDNKAAEEAKKNLKDWDANFMKDLDQDTIFELILAANYLNVKGVFNLACQTIADDIKDKKVEEVRRIFNFENDYTPEEEDAVRKENQWAFE